MSIVFTGGTFDLFHEGHVQLLKACKKIAGETGKVVVSLNTDDFVFKFKNVTPTMTFEERKRVLESCRYVDEVIENIGQDKSVRTIENYGEVDFVVIGDDWAPPKDYYNQMGFSVDWLNDRDITLVYVDRNTGMSSTKIRERLKNAGN